MKKSLLFLIAGSLVLTTGLSGANFQDHLKLFDKAVAEKNLAAAEKHASDAVLLLNTLNKHIVVRHCDMLLRPYLNAKEFKTVDKLYTAMICNTSGYNQAILLDKYAKFLEREKFAKQEVIAKIKADRYKVKDLDFSLKFDFLVGDNDLQAAANLAESIKWQDHKMLDRVIRAFRGKGIYGSTYALKFYKKRIDLAQEADKKVVALQEYADFCREYAFLTDEEIEKLLATRSTLSGLTEHGRWAIKLYDFRNTPDQAVRIKILKELSAQSKTNYQFRDLNNLIAKMPPVPEVFETYEKTILPALDANAIQGYAGNYVTASRKANRYKESVNYLSDLALAKKTPQHFCVLAAAYDAFSKRYYAEPDPILLERAMLAYQTAYELLPEDDCYKRMEVLLRLTDLACRRNNRSEVESFAAMGMNMEIPSGYRQKTPCENAKRYLFALPQAMMAYAENDFTTVVAILKPVLGKRVHFPGGTSPDNGTAYEIFVRSLVALGEYREALKYTDDMIRTAPGYMRERLKVQVNELRQRAAEKKD